MSSLPQKNEEKKVEYIELVYDLIFVYIIGRNNLILHNTEGGFVSVTTFLAYVLSTLAIIQIWNFSTFYINMFGKNSIRNYVMLFINMYLLYFIGQSTRSDWQEYQNQYHMAWALILINTGIQYILESREHKNNKELLKTINHMMISLFGEAAIILIAIPVYNRFGIQIALAAVLYGIIVTWIFADDEKAELVDFTHLSERAMLYVVFSFGEMIIAIAEYFEGKFTLNLFYFSMMSFLIVAALFLCYGLLYDRIINRELKTTGMVYMFIHILLIFSMNNITVALEFMRNEGVSITPKLLFLSISFLIFFTCIFLLMLFAKDRLKMCSKLIARVAIISIIFVVLMLAFKSNMYVNIAITVIYAYSVFGSVFLYSRNFERQS